MSSASAASRRRDMAATRRRASAATSSAPRRLRVKAMARDPPATSPASSRADWPWPDARVPATSSTTGGFHSTNTRSPRGDPSSTTSATGRPHSAEASSPGRPMVAEQNTNVGSDP